MADTNNSHEKEVKVEDLLRLKRAERPSEVFWNTFDRELHQRMLQTLVKKDSWYVQVLRGVSGRIAQTVAVGALAAFLALMVMRPALVDSTQANNGANGAYVALQKNELDFVNSAPLVDAAMSDLNPNLIPDYQIEAISGSIIDSGYANEYSPDSFELASYDRDVYAMDSVSLAGTGLAITLVY
ncbi:MAG: hypothetical protein VX033_07250 [Verrucomicrobiota bacterium]|nr:hypothetical protein [Verrucomicrobiota bacterium]